MWSSVRLRSAVGVWGIDANGQGWGKWRGDRGCGAGGDACARIRRGGAIAVSNRFDTPKEEELRVCGIGAIIPIEQVRHSVAYRRNIRWVP